MIEHFKPKTATEVFHRHLECCEQCEKHPFDLCLIGAIWLKRAAMDGKDSSVQEAVEHNR